ncbi:MAG TPA: DUF882 domain-containing protein [Rickettsiales bacterium]|nr:DUF882 domain-containing protein [Rickettsiales bacterium]
MKMTELLTRRSLLKAGFALATSSVMPSSVMAAVHAFAEEEKRSLHFYNVHTGESLKTVYWEQGVYVSDAMKDIAYIMRDYRSNDMIDIDPHLLDVIALLHKNLDSRKPFDVISGYRTPRTNAYLHKHTGGVNPNSLHMQGKAIDIRLDDCRLRQVRDMATSMHKGGVGYYPGSDFVHIDTGPVKHWRYDL